jgi:RimJ/RimL family protein N-acetyltransferase
MRYFPKIPGERVYLSPINLEDAELYTAWLNDLKTARYLMTAPMQVTLHGERDALVELSKQHAYAIVAREGEELLGNCGLHNIDQISRSAEVGIFIGEDSRRGEGYGTEALRLLCDYGFYILNLRSIQLRTYAYNERAVACYKKAGFKEAGRFRKAHFYGGQYHDLLLMDILPEDFGPSHLPPPGD